jgi:hypothetical protein
MGAFDAVVGYHMSTFTCGVARFNEQLAIALSVPVRSIHETDLGSRPLLSIKLSEMTPAHRARFGDRAWIDRLPVGFGLFLHDFDGTPDEVALTTAAGTVFAGNAEITERIQAFRSDVVEAFSPVTLDLSAPIADPTLKVFTFGMAHKVRADHYRRLNTLLARTGLDYGLYVSTALHEDMDFDEAVRGAFDGIREVFNGPVHFLGFLSDEAVAMHLRQCAFLAAFFPHGARANNSTVNTGLQAGTVVVTNLDRWSPRYMRHGQTLIDIERCDRLPDESERLVIAGQARDASRQVSWDALMRLVHERTASFL